MKDTSIFTPEEIKEYKIITMDSAINKIENFKKNWNSVKERANQYMHIRTDTILIERIDYGQRGSAIERDPAKSEGRTINSCYGLVLSVSPLPSINQDIEQTKAILRETLLKEGVCYINYNHNSAYSLNTLDWKTSGNPELERLYKTIWVIGVEGLLFIDLEHSRYGRYDELAIKQIIDNQELSVEAALSKIEFREQLKNENKEEPKEESKEEIKTSLFEDGKINTLIKGGPTPKFYK